MTLLNSAGPLLYGRSWHAELARAIGRFHPRGARASIDRRLVFRWECGERPEPAWLDGAIRTLIRERIEALDNLAGSDKHIRTEWSTVSEISLDQELRSEIPLEENS